MDPRYAGSTGKAGPVLVIDDDEIALQAIADLLRQAGYDVHTLASPIGATQVIASQGIAAAVIDLNMPVMRGDRFIALVRSWDRIRDLPIVLVSGESRNTILDAAQRLPGVAVVTKAQLNELLVPTVKQVLNGRASHPDAPRALAPLEGVTRAPRPRQETPAPVPRALPQLARTALTAWQGLAAAAFVAPQLCPALSALQAETKQLGLAHTTELLGLTLQVVEQCMSAKEVSLEADVAITELLSQLATTSGDKMRSFERSLALTLLRSRLERVRQART